MASKKIKVLNVIPTFEINGGIENYVYNLLRELDSKKFKLDVLAYSWQTDSSSKYEYIKLYENLGISTYSVPDPTKNLFRFMKEVKKFFQLHNYDIVHAHPSSTAWYFLSQAYKAGVKCRILHVHETRLSDKVLHRFRNFLFFPIGKYFATQYAAVSKAAAEKYFKNKEASVIYPAVDKNKFKFNNQFRKSWRKHLGLNDNDFILGAVGRFCNAKNFEFALKVLRTLSKDSNIKLIVCGDGELRIRYLNLIRKWGLEKNAIVLYPTSKINELYSAFDCLIMPSIHEGFGLVGVEAQYNGLPVLVSKHVPKDIDLGNCKYLILSKSVWVEEIRKIQSEHKRSVNLENDKFNYKRNAKILCDYYLSSCSKCCSL